MCGLFHLHGFQGKRTVLHDAAVIGKADMVSILLAAGAEVTARDKVKRVCMYEYNMYVCMYIICMYVYVTFFFWF